MSHSSYELNDPEQLSYYSNLAKNEQTICTFMAYICDKENPFHVTDTTDSRLHHILTKEVLPESHRKSLLEFRHTGEAAYNLFRKERMIDKTDDLLLYTQNQFENILKLSMG